MFPFEAATPTGISASCYRSIKGGAGRPLELGDFRMEGIFSSKYVPKYAPIADDETEKTRKGSSICFLLLWQFSYFWSIKLWEPTKEIEIPFLIFLMIKSQAKAN
uniref:Uncharacterized protein n=1 Tax=Monodelphis domestica TaxID=13616 RepID=A0A5F8GRC4_MONDO